MQFLLIAAIVDMVIFFRIATNRYFVEKILAQAEENLERKYRLEAEGYDFNMVADRAAHLMSLKGEEVLSPGKYKKSRGGSWYGMLLSHA